MNRKSIINFSCIVSLMIMMFSCDELEQPTYSEEMNRFATVHQSGDVVDLVIDYTQESITLSNFKTAADMESFGVHNNSRVLAKIQVDMVGDVTNYKYTLLSVDTISVNKIDYIEEYQDTLDRYFTFEKLQINSAFYYPSVWTNSHFLNMNLLYFSTEENLPLCKFHLYPKDVKGDTLRMRIISELPDSVAKEGYNNSDYFCYDMSTLRNGTAQNAEQQKKIDLLLSQLEAQNKDSIYVEVATSDTLSIINYINWVKIAGSKRVVRMSFDF